MGDHSVRNSDVRRRAITSVKAQIDAAASTLKHRTVELDQLLRDQAAADAEAERRRGRYQWLTKGMRFGVR